MYFGFENVSVAYGRKQILNNVTLSVEKGEILTLIGKNGCGKSSLLKTVSKAVIPADGRILLEDRPLKKYRRSETARRIAYLPQVHSAPPDISVRTLVSYGRYPYSRFGRSLSAADKEIIDETLDYTGLSGLRDRAVTTLSGGERQRAWLAMSICQQPEILILDEPTTYLDISYQIEVLELIRKLNTERNTTIIMVLHDINLASRFSDRLCALKNGGIYCLGKPEDIVTAANLLKVFDIDAEVFMDGMHARPFFLPLKTVIHKEDY